MVVGYDSPKYGESVSAAVVLTEDDPDFEQKLDKHMRENIAGYKIPVISKTDTYAFKFYFKSRQVGT